MVPACQILRESRTCGWVIDDWRNVFVAFKQVSKTARVFDVVTQSLRHCSEHRQRVSVRWWCYTQRYESVQHSVTEIILDPAGHCMPHVTCRDDFSQAKLMTVSTRHVTKYTIHYIATPWISKAGSAAGGRAYQMALTARVGPAMLLDLADSVPAPAVGLYSPRQFEVWCSQSNDTVTPVGRRLLFSRNLTS